MTTERKIEIIRSWIESIRKAQSLIELDLVSNMTRGMIHAWGMDSTIDYSVCKELSEEMSTAYTESLKMEWTV